MAGLKLGIDESGKLTPIHHLDCNDQVFLAGNRANGIRFSDLLSFKEGAAIQVLPGLEFKLRFEVRRYFQPYRNAL